MHNRLKISAAALLIAILALAAGGCLRPASESSHAPLASTPTVAQAPSPADLAPPPREFSMIVVGDVMLDRNVWKAIQANGYRNILAKVRDDLRSADITFGNLECPLSTVGPHSPSENLMFRADPRAVKVLVDGGFDVVSLANNHSLNAGKAGLLQTMEHLDDAGIAYCGANGDRERSWEPTRFIVGGIELGFVACTDLSFQHGSWCKVDDDLSSFRERIAAADAQCDLLVVSIHWGNEYQKKPTKRQRAVAHAAIEAGADLVIGQHPHVLQGVGAYEGAPILYSCGNFVFDQREGERMESAIFHLRFIEGEGWRVRLVPVWIPRSRMGPIYPSTERAAKIITRMTELSENLGVTVTVKGNEGNALIPGDRLRKAGDSERIAGPDPDGDSPAI